MFGSPACWDADATAEAEDAVQETYTRWYAMSRQQREAVESPGAWLTTIASRVCLDLLGSVRARRERYVSEWIPEPLPAPAEWSSGLPDGAMADPHDDNLPGAVLVAVAGVSNDTAPRR